MDIIEKGNVIEKKSGFPSGDVLGSVAGRIFVRGTAGIDLQDYVDSVVKAFTIDGVLTFVPPKYYIYSYFVNAGMADKTSLITALILVDFERMQEIYAQYGDDIIIKDMLPRMEDHVIASEYQLHIPLCQLRTVRREHGNS